MTDAANGQRPASLFELIGGQAAFTQLVDVFYREVAADAYLIAMYPEGHELDGAKWRLQAFLEQYFGGPTTYSQQRGHPRLRMRHHPFPVTPKAREHWLAHMRTALDSLDLAPLHDTMVWDYFERAATAMINTFDEPDAQTHPAAAQQPQAGAESRRTLGLTPES